MNFLTNLSKRKRGFMTPAKSTGKVATPVLALDCLLEENPSFNAVPTESPVEDGVLVSDHVALKPLKLTIHIVQSNSPINLVGQFNKTNKNNLQDAFNFLVKLHKDRMPFDFIGGLQVYPNMVITGLDVARSKDKANGLFATVTMQQLIIVSSKTVLDSNIKKGSAGLAGGQEEKGSQTPTDASDKAQDNATSPWKKAGGIANKFLVGIVGGS